MILIKIFMRPSDSLRLLLTLQALSVISINFLLVISLLHKTLWSQELRD